MTIQGLIPTWICFPSEVSSVAPTSGAGSARWIIPIALIFLALIFLGMLFPLTLSLSQAQMATSTIIPINLFVSPMPSADNPMAMIEEFARQTSVVQTAVASNGTPNSSQITATVGAAFTQAASAIITSQAVFSTSTAIVSNPPTGFVSGIKVSSVGIDATTPEGESEITSARLNEK